MMWLKSVRAVTAVTSTRLRLSRTEFSEFSRVGSGPRRSGLLCLPRTQRSRRLWPRAACCQTGPLGRAESPRVPFCWNAYSLHHRLLCLIPLNLFPISVHLLLIPLSSFHFYITINLENQILCFAMVLCIHHMLDLSSFLYLSCFLML